MWSLDMHSPTESDATKLTPARQGSLSADDTQPMQVANVTAKPKTTWIWLIAIPVFVVLVWGGAAASGYIVGLDKRQAKQIQMVAKASQEQFDLGVEDLLAGRFELARHRFEYVLSLAPNYPGAAELLGRALEALNQPTPTASPIASPTPTETPDLGSFEGMFQSAQAAFDRGDWSTALDILILLRGEDPNFRLSEVNQIMRYGLRNRGMDKLFQGRLEEGIYDLSLAERFGSLDAQALSWRRSAKFFIFANSYYGLDWRLASEYLGQICKANIWGACVKYARAACEYGHELLAEEQYCLASFNYEQFFTYLSDNNLAPTATEVAIVCMTATAPIPTPTSTMTPGTSTPEGTLTVTSTSSSTFTPSPSMSATASATTDGAPTETATPTATSSVTMTPTATPTATVTPTATPSPTSPS